MVYDIPGYEHFEIKTIILDLNGTLSVAGSVPEGAKELLQAIKERGFDLILFTGNTRNDAEELTSELGIDWILAKSAEDKRDLAVQRDSSTCASIGNGLIDLELTKVVRLGVVTLQAEGVHTQTLLAADIVVPTINDALDLFIDDQRLISTLRR